MYCPLSDNGVTDEDVQTYWSQPPHGLPELRIPDGAGNCVYCFLKGPAALARLAAQISGDEPEKARDTPVDIRWWARIEQQYGRPSTTRNGRIGMFHDTDYGAIMLRASLPEALNDNGANAGNTEVQVPCSCTD